MNLDLAKLIVEQGKEIWGYVALRSHYVVHCSPDQPLVLSREEAEKFGGEQYLTDLRTCGLLKFTTNESGYVITLYEDGWLGFDKDKVVRREVKKKPNELQQLLNTLLELLEKPIDFHEGGFNKKYPTLLSKLREDFSEDDIILAAKAAGKETPLNQFLTRSYFLNFLTKGRSLPKDRSTVHRQYESWADV